MVAIAAAFASRVAAAVAAGRSHVWRRECGSAGCVGSMCARAFECTL